MVSIHQNQILHQCLYRPGWQSNDAAQLISSSPRFLTASIDSCIPGQILLGYKKRGFGMGKYVFKLLFRDHIHHRNFRYNGFGKKTDLDRSAPMLCSVSIVRRESRTWRNAAGSRYARTRGTTSPGCWFLFKLSTISNRKRLESRLLSTTQAAFSSSAKAQNGHSRSKYTVQNRTKVSSRSELLQLSSHSHCVFIANNTGPTK